eukprot:m.268583 g.268583  ORF g.268583 m.268583 type:complete len:93 (+) comp19294_c0_seq2:329-607(+)
MLLLQGAIVALSYVGLGAVLVERVLMSRDTNVRAGLKSVCWMSYAANFVATWLVYLIAAASTDWAPAAATAGGVCSICITTWTVLIASVVSN